MHHKIVLWKEAVRVEFIKEDSLWFLCWTLISSPKFKKNGKQGDNVLYPKNNILRYYKRGIWELKECHWVLMTESENMEFDKMVDNDRIAFNTYNIEDRTKIAQDILDKIRNKRTVTLTHNK